MVMDERERQITFPRGEPSYDYIWFGDFVLGGRLINQTMTKKQDGIIMRRLAILPSPELMERYQIDPNKDLTYEGLVILWVPDHWIENDLTNDYDLGRRTFVWCDYRLEPTKMMERMKGKFSNTEHLLGQIQNLSAQVIQMRREKLRDSQNPDGVLDKQLQRMKDFAEVMGYGASREKQRFPEGT